MVFLSSVYQKRLDTIAYNLSHASLDALIVAAGSDLSYCGGISAETHERLMWLIVPAQGKNPVLIIPQLELKLFRESPIADCVEVKTWLDGDDPIDIVRDLLGERARVAVTEDCVARHIVPLAEKLHFPLTLGDTILNTIRKKKDAAEIAAILEAGAAIDRVHRNVPDYIHVGRSEAEIAELIRNDIVAQGHESAAFVIVGSGPNGADPHHSYSERIIQAGDIVVIDIGGPMASGYYSDCTRTYSVGEPTEEIAAMIDELCQAQQSAVAAVQAGMLAEELDNIARSHLAQSGLDKNFIHRLGHGIGLSVHEAPNIAPGESYVIETGNAFSIEPGIYFPGKWGARIEDIVIVQEDGAISANNTEHGLHIIA